MTDLELAKEIIESFLKRRFEHYGAEDYWTALINIDDDIEDHIRMVIDVMQKALKEVECSKRKRSNRHQKK